MSISVQAVRGMNDILPAESARWQYLEAAIARVLQHYGYGEIRMPIVEKTQLFTRSIGEVTDIVEKEMYTFDDRGGDQLSLRPEGTASCVRAALERGMLYNQTQRLWYIGPMFRRERPQQGRYRQFHQIGVETFGFATADIDAELILLGARLWRELGVDGVRLEINSLGTTESRAQYRQILSDYFTAAHDQLDEDSQRRLKHNPLRILDSKNPALAELIANAPSILDHLDDESAEHFATLKTVLDDAGIAYIVNPRLVRGLDYYSRTVFEWKTDRLGAQDAICSGGRYDGLVEQLGGKPTPAAGFAMGMERVLALLPEDAGQAPAPQIYLAAVGSAAQRFALQLAEQLRDSVADLRLITHCGGGSFKAVLRRADKSGAAYALIIGEDELAANTVTVKPLREKIAQHTIAVSQLTAWLQANL